MVNRERYEEFHKTVHVARVVGLALGFPSERIYAAEEALELAIFQTAYDPNAIRRRMQKAASVAKQQREKRLRDARLMDSVASMSREDGEDQDNLLHTPSAAVPSREAKGVQAPWKK